eukprot:136747-Amphidinium_carterae.1
MSSQAQQNSNRVAHTLFDTKAAAHVLVCVLGSGGAEATLRETTIVPNFKRLGISSRLAATSSSS